MVELLILVEDEIPPELKNQVLGFMRLEWPGAFKGDKPDRNQLNDPNLHPVCLLLVEAGRVLSYTGILWKYIEHKGQNYKAYSLSGVLTNPAYRNRGYGHQIVAVAHNFILNSDADIGLFTCDAELQEFYEKSGWAVLANSVLIGGTRQKPFRSDFLGKVVMIGYFSALAQATKVDFERADIYLDLKEGDLW